MKAPALLFNLALLCAPMGATAQLAQGSPDMQNLQSLAAICTSSTSAFDAYRANVANPPVLGGETWKTAFADVCSLVVKIYDLANKASLLQAKLELKSTTQANWQQQLLLGVAVSSVAASKYYTEAQPTQPAEIENAREDDDMKSFYESIASNDRAQASSFENEREQAQKMDAFQLAVRRRTMLSESLACPDMTNNPNYRAAYDQEIAPLAIERKLYLLKRDHYLQRLKEIGSSFSAPRDASLYGAQLEELRRLGVIIRASTTTVAAPYYVKSKAPVAGDPAVVTKTNGASVSTQAFYSEPDLALFESFKKAWGLKWKDYADKTTDKIDKALNMSDACVGNAPPRTDILSPGEVNSFAAYEQNCLPQIADALAAKQPPAFYFEEALARYRDNAQLYAGLQAQILTKESKLLSRPLYADQAKPVDLANSPNCGAEPMSDAKLLETRVKMTAAESEYKEIIASETVKDSMLRDEELKRQRADAERQRMERSLASEKRGAEKEAIQGGMASPDLGGAF